MSQTSSTFSSGRFIGAVAVVVFGTVLSATFFQTCFSSRLLAASFFSPSTWIELAQSQSRPFMSSPNQTTINLPFQPFITILGLSAGAAWILGAGWLVFYRRRNWSDALIQWGFYGWIWWCLLDLWEWLWIATGIAGLENVTSLFAVTPQFWAAICLAGWVTTFLALQTNPEATSDLRRIPSTHRLWIFCGGYSVVFIAMNWQLYANLLIPHGDSVMYEEHLWNLLHGKGFRSYLDRGLFLGEHIQFVHLFLIPLYVIWPSHLLLETCSTIALALGAFPVFWMTQRQLGNRPVNHLHGGGGVSLNTNPAVDRVALAASVAYLLYFPTQFLDIEIDLKTFRPESFGIPLLLLTLDQLDRKNVWGTLVGIAFCLTVKEDYTLIFGPLGLWIACQRDGVPTLTGTVPGHQTRKNMMLGLLFSVFSVAYLWLAMRVLMPWFRSGDEVHYASYFSRFGSTPEEILKTWVTNPGSVITAFFTFDTALYAIALLAPLAFLPLFAPSRLAVGFPLFAILCLNELEGSRTPQHQFHAPLVAIVFWSLAAALPAVAEWKIWIVDALGRRLSRSTTRVRRKPEKSLAVDVKRGDPHQFSTPPQSRLDNQTLIILGHLVWTCSMATGLFFSLSPLGIPFWDQGSSWYWKKLYLTNHRAMSFQEVLKSIPTSARVASTDFIHPRFTHFERSYDYSDYLRKINEAGERVPSDTDFIVIDTRHKYSKVKSPQEVPEYRDHPELWELLPDTTEGDYIVLKRKSPN